MLSGNINYVHCSDKQFHCIAPLINCQTVSVPFQCPDSFVVGYGMDYAELYRNLPYVGVLKPEMYNKKTSN
jgi:hypoxanthine-guanine phosphoribosyltransferase